MVDLHFLFFEFGPAVKFIFEISYIPQEEDFKELTPDQYRAMYAKLPEEDLKHLQNKKILAFIPDDVSVYNRVIERHGNNLMIVTSEEVSVFARTSVAIDSLLAKSDKKFDSLREKLICLARTLPDVFSKDTPYAIYAKVKGGMPEDKR